MKSNWPTKKLGEIAKIFAGSSAPQDEKYFVNGRYPFFRVSDLSGQKNKNLTNSRDLMNDLAAKELRLTKAKKNSILFPKSGAAILTNSRAILKVDGYVVSHLAVIEANQSRVLPYYLYAFLCNFDMGDLVNDPAYPSLKISDVKELEIPLPPLSEQKRIVEKIEKVFAKIDKAQKLRESALADSAVLLPSVLHHIFERAEKEGWEEKKFKDVVEIDTTRNGENNLPFVGMEDVETHSGNFVGSKEPRNVMSTTFHFDTRHVLYGKLRPYLNKVFVPGFEGHCSTEFLPLLPSENFLTREWLAIWLRYEKTVNGIMATVTGARMPRANMDRVKEFTISFPSLAEQQKIVAYLDSLSDKTRRLQELQKTQLADFSALRQSVLHQAFQGKL